MKWLLPGGADIDKDVFANADYVIFGADPNNEEDKSGAVLLRNSPQQPYCSVLMRHVTCSMG